MEWSDHGLVLKEGGRLIPKCMQLESNVNMSYLHHNSTLKMDYPRARFRLTNIIVSAGPSTRNPGVIDEFLKMGINAFNVKCYDEDNEIVLQDIIQLRNAVKNYGSKLGAIYSLAIAYNIKGPEIRTGFMSGGRTEVKLQVGDILKLTIDSAYLNKGTSNTIYIDYQNIINVIEPDDEIVLDYGKIKLVCIDIQGQNVVCKITEGGYLSCNVIAHLIGVEIDLPVLTQKDKNDIKFAIKHKVNFIVAALIRSASAIQEIRNELGVNGKDIGIIAKIENEKGVENVEEIIKEADGIMIGRELLGFIYPTEKTVVAQKYIIAKCNYYGKPVMCCSEILPSMETNYNPSFAEVCDITNAVVDGVDGLVLTNETAYGKYPVECVRTLYKTSKDAEAAHWAQPYILDMCFHSKFPFEVEHSLAFAACVASYKCLAAAIIVATSSGKVANLLSKYRPKCPIILVSDCIKVTTVVSLLKGIFPMYVDTADYIDTEFKADKLIEIGVKAAKRENFIMSSDPIVILITDIEEQGRKNTLKVIYVSDIIQPVIY